MGAGVGTIIYALVTRFKSPAFLGSSFAFIGSMLAAFAGAASMSIGYFGLIIGSTFAGLVYVIIGLIVKKVGTGWIDKLMPPVIIGPIIAIIGLTLAPKAISNLFTGDVLDAYDKAVSNVYVCLACGLITLFATIITSVYGGKHLKLIPFIIGIGAGYLTASIFTIFGNAFNVDALKIVNWAPVTNFKWLPDFAFIKAIEGIKEFKSVGEAFAYIGIVAVAYIPVAFVCFAEHIGDHKNLSFITGHDLLKDPGLDRTVTGDGLGSIAGAIIGGCPNTTYGESISCIALSRNASIWTVMAAAILSIIISFIGPLFAVLSTIPTCVIGGISIALYGFIASSGFQMLTKVDMSKVKNIFVIATILVTGIGGLAIQVQEFQFSPIATALVLGIIVNLIVNHKPKEKKTPEEQPAEVEKVKE